MKKLFVIFFALPVSLPGSVRQAVGPRFLYA
jgi:hypothetical protein